MWDIPYGHSGWRQANEPAKQAIISQMNGSKFPFMGASPVVLWEIILKVMVTLVLLGCY
jgi:hypothetical protein